MLEGVKCTMSFWMLILKSRRKLGKSFINKICLKNTHLNYLFYNLSSHMKSLIDNEAVRFGLERTLYFLIPLLILHRKQTGTRYQPTSLLILYRAQPEQPNTPLISQRRARCHLLVWFRLENLTVFGEELLYYLTYIIHRRNVKLADFST